LKERIHLILSTFEELNSVTQSVDESLFSVYNELQNGLTRLFGDVLKFFEYNPFLNEPDVGVEMQLKSVLSEFRNLMRQNQVLKSKSVMSFTNRNNTLMTQQSALSYSQPPEFRLTENQRNVSEMFAEQRESQSASFNTVNQIPEIKISEAPMTQEVDHYSVYEKRRTTINKQSDLVEFEEQLRSSTQKDSQFKKKSNLQESVISPKPSNLNQEFSVKDIASYNEENRLSEHAKQSDVRLTNPERNTNMSSQSKAQNTVQTPKHSSPNVFDPYENSSMSVKNEHGQSRVSEPNEQLGETPRLSKESDNDQGSIRNSGLNEQPDGSVRNTGPISQPKISEVEKISLSINRNQTNQLTHNNQESIRTIPGNSGTSLTQQSRSQVHSNIGQQENNDIVSQKESFGNIDRSQISHQTHLSLQQPHSIQGRPIEYSMSAKESDLGDCDPDNISHEQTIHSQNQQRFTGMSHNPSQTNMTRMTNQNETEIQSLTNQTRNNQTIASNNQKGTNLSNVVHQSIVGEDNRVSGLEMQQKDSSIVSAKQTNLSQLNRGTDVGSLQINPGEARVTEYDEVSKVSQLSGYKQTDVRQSNIPGAEFNDPSGTNLTDRNLAAEHLGKSSNLSRDPSNLQSIGQSEQLPHIPSLYSKGVQLTNLQEQAMSIDDVIEKKNASFNAPGPGFFNDERNLSAKNSNLSYAKDPSVYKPEAYNQALGSMKTFDVPESFSYISQNLAMGERQPRDTTEVRFFRPSDATPSQKNVLRVAFNNVPESYRKINASVRNTDHSFDQRNFDSFNKNQDGQEGNGDGTPQEERRGSQIRQSRAMSQAENNLYDYIERRISTLAANSKIELQHVINAEPSRKKSKSIFQNLPNLSDLGIDGSNSINIHFGDKDSTKRSEYIKMYRPTKNLTLPQLKDFAEEFYTAKQAYDIRCTKMETPRLTSEEFLCIYLKQKYGLNELVQEWAFTIVASMKRYADKDVDISVFFRVELLDFEK
jgi:hypothetical protein